jgi:hypothetical protein
MHKFLILCFIVAFKFNSNSYACDRVVQTQSEGIKSIEEILEAMNNVEPVKLFHAGYIDKSSMKRLRKKINEAILEANSRPVKINIKLRSLGGEIYWAYDMVNYIKKLNEDPNIEINTHVTSSCESSCTILYTAGENRYAHKNARFGFHKPTFQSGKTNGKSPKQIESQFRSLWIKMISKVDKEASEFLANNNYFDEDEMRYLKSKELLSGYVTEVI